jgi:hypothetical protein
LAQAIQADNPLAYYQFNESSGNVAIDSSGHNRHGTYQGGISKSFNDAAPLLGYAINSTVAANHSVAIPDLGLQGQFSFEALIYPRSYETWDTIYDVDGFPAGAIHIHLLASGELEVGISGALPYPHFGGPADFPLNRGTHLVVTYDASTGEVAAYANGRLLGRHSVSSTGQNVVLGAGHIAAWNGNSRYFDGLIDEVAMYSHVLDPLQVARHYHASTGRRVEVTALGRASQSSTWGGFLPADLALDGNLNSPSITERFDVDPWWQLDLQTEIPIAAVVLHNRVDCCQSRLRDITVEILDAENQVVYMSPLLNSENAGYAYPQGPPAITVDLVALAGAPVTGQTIRVRRASDPDLSGSGGQGNVDEPDSLQLGEVQVWASMPQTDQRGKPRPSDSGYDIGSFEFQYSPDYDYDLDFAPNSTDNCPFDWNYDQTDYDGDGNGDACDDGVFLSARLAYANQNVTAPDKLPLFLGETPTFANYSSYEHGLSYLVIESVSPRRTLSNVQFRVSDRTQPGVWHPAPNPVYSGSSHPPNGIDRYAFGWANGAIVNQWLEVTIPANERTGLAEPVVFYFGHALGETGNVPGSTRVDEADRDAVLQRADGRAADLASPYDINRDGVIDAADVALVEANYTGLAADFDDDGAVGLTDLAFLQSGVNRKLDVPPDFATGDFNGDGHITRADVARLVQSSVLSGFGARATAQMLANRLPSSPYSLPPPPPPPSPSPSPAAEPTAPRLTAARITRRLSARAVDGALTDDPNKISPVDQATATTTIRARRVRR